MKGKIKIKTGQQALKIIDEGHYTLENKIIDIKEKIRLSVDASILYTPESFSKFKNDFERSICEKKYSTKISVVNKTTQQAIEDLIDKNMKIAALNFASAKNPGGGFLGNAKAQEESLTRASTLYPTLTKYYKEMYEFNRSRKTYLYSDYMIYSPEVIFFKDSDEYLLQDPYFADILTSPAVNLGAAAKNNPGELKYAEQTMRERLDKILSVFVVNRADAIVLGAWGCGVFRNNPEDVARYFCNYVKEGGKYSQCFKKIIFAVYDRSKSQENISAFQKILE
ncbi:TIGR02452 family protein [Apibacter raozihei]|uniref:TIGR02452 family protein n=1 Tax=Apibacter TaxID=1778601 RepID=UPI000FE41BE3|nr:MULTISPECIES: TIGR02452 family protein [Apibacter]